MDQTPSRMPPPATTPQGSLERRLPLLMSTVLVAVVLASLVLTFGTLTRGAEASTRERMEGAVGQLATGVEATLVARGERLRVLARDPSIDVALAGSADRSLLLAAFVEQLNEGERSYPNVLLDRLGSPVFSTGELSDAQRSELLRVAGSEADTIRVGRMFTEGDTAAFFWTAGPVRRGGNRVGALAQLRRVGGPRDAQATLRNLIGDNIAMYVRNVDGSVWIEAPGSVVPRATRRDTTGDGITQVRPGIGSLLGVEARVKGAPWIVSLEAPVAAVHAQAARTTAELSAISLVLAALGVFAAWIISRSITRPLAELSRAAGALARGQAGASVDTERIDEIGRLAESFNQMAAEVEAGRRELERRVAEADQANRTKSDFLAVMSHELRTPLNAIGGYTQLLDLEVYGPLNDAQRDALTRLERSQAHLLRLINNVLSFSRIDSGQLEYRIESVAVDEALSALEDLVAPQLQVRGVSFVHESSGSAVTVAADREKLQQIVLNLLSNSIKFTAPGGRITISCDPREESVDIVVADTGCGIAADVLPHIFDPFVQANRALHRPSEGVGLGLAIARDLARGMGGDLTVSSEVGNGSAFRITLPVGSDVRTSYTHPVASTASPANRS
jgi:signal transduction histidine kinase